MLIIKTEFTNESLIQENEKNKMNLFLVVFNFTVEVMNIFALLFLVLFSPLQVLCFYILEYLK